MGGVRFSFGTTLLSIPSSSSVGIWLDGSFLVPSNALLVPVISFKNRF